MARKPVIDMSAWPSVSLEGNLIAPAMVATIDRREASEQDEADYGVRKGLTLRDEISTAFRVGQSHFDAFSRLENPSAEATRRFVQDFLRETFGFDDLGPGNDVVALIAGKGRVPVVVVPPNEEKLDRKSPTLSTDRTRSAAFALQDWLNEHDEALWGLVTNGRTLRLMRDNASLTRPAYIEADLAQIFTNEDAASFSILWLLIHRSRFGAAGAPATDCALERWREAGAREGVAARDHLADQVQMALKLLGSGFLGANPDLRTRLQSGEVNLTDWFNELLRLVYRLIFLMVAEDRSLLHPENARAPARDLYAQGYSLTMLRAACTRGATRDRHHDRYEGIKVVFRALATGEPRLGLPALGGLFATGKLPTLETARLSNRAFMEAIYRLSWLRQKTGMVPVNWRAMETEELGSVYESLLELQPQLSDDGRELIFASEAAEKKGNQRKTTGSYYTPDSLVQALLDTALDPVLDKTEAQADDPEQALLNLSIIDPACGSGHFLLAAARRIATRLARIRAEGTPALADFRHALRDVARACLYGVDRNPMAVELTKVALWIETVDPGKPLGFFDAQIRCGDALLGVFDLKVLEDGIPDAAYKPLTGDDKDTARFYLKTNRDEKSGQGSFDFSGGRSSLPAAPLSAEFADLRELPEDSVAEVEAKARAYRSLRKKQAFQRARMGCNLYVSAFLLPKAGPVPRGDGERSVPTSEDVWLAIGEGKGRRKVMENARAATSARALHWPLEFPDVMQRGGFDVVLGNPPWEVMQLSDKEHFATRKPEIAALAGAARKRAIEALREADPAAYQEFVTAKHMFDAVNEFARASGRFDLTAKGKVNTYALFAELFANLSRARAGVIVPTGIATDATTAPFFAHLVESRRLARLVDFENSAPQFPGVHRSFKFCLLTLGRDEPQAHFAFFLTDPAQLAEPARNFTLSPEDIAAINPNTRTAPVFRSRRDAELTALICLQAMPLIKLDGRKEQSAYLPTIILNFFSGSNSTDSQLFEKHRDAGPSPELYPVLRGADIWQYDHRFPLTLEEKLPERECYGDGRFVPKTEVEKRLSDKGWNRGWLMGWRDITNATNERTVIATVFPRWASDDTLSLLLPHIEPKLCAALLANLNSLTLDYAALSKVGGTHIRKHVIAQFPVLPPEFYTEPRLAFVTPRVLELTYTSHSLAPFARDLGHDGPPFKWNEDRRATLRAELDAFFARAYGLSRDELRYILDPAEVMGADYPSETFRVLKEKEIKKHGEYRTARLVLEAWDRMEAGGEFKELEL